MTIFRTCATSLVLVFFGFHFVTDGQAQGYPSKPVRYIVSGSPGSGTHTLARIITEKLSQILSQQVVVENRSGGGSNIAADLAAKAPPDGYSMMQATITLAVNVTLYPKLSYDLIRDFAPVTRLATAPNVVVVHPSLPVKSISELIKLAKAKPGAIDYSSGGAGTNSFLAAELFKGQAGVNMVHIAYKGGGPALLGAITGEVSIHFAPAATAVPALQQKLVRALGVTSTKRLDLLPGIPTVTESGLRGYETGNWYGLIVPAKTPRETINAIHNAAIRVINSPDVIKRLTDLGYVTIGDTPEEFAAYIKVEVERLGKLVKAFNLQPE